MKVLLINGSPHQRGCTYTALAEVAKSLEENGVGAEIAWIGAGAVHGCIACGKCGELGRCVFDGDACNEIRAKALEADGLIVGSPVYYAAPNGALLSLLQRLFYSGSAALSHKPGACVVSARRAGTTASLDALQKYFTISHMPLVSSQYWCMVHGNTPEEVRQDKEGMQIMRSLGRDMAWLLRCIEAGRQAGIHPPAPEEPRVFTNFIR